MLGELGQGGFHLGSPREILAACWVSFYPASLVGEFGLRMCSTPSAPSEKPLQEAFSILWKFPEIGLCLNSGQSLPFEHKLSGWALEKCEEPSCAHQTALSATAQSSCPKLRPPLSRLSHFRGWKKERSKATMCPSESSTTLIHEETSRETPALTSCKEQETRKT